MIKLILSTEKTISSYAVRLFSWSGWSHVSTIIDDTYAIEAISNGGVVKTPIQDIISKSSNHKILEVNIKNTETFYNAITSQLGKPYDTSAIFGFVFHRNWQDDSDWFCSELPAWATNQCGEPVFNNNEIYKVLPEDWNKIHPNRLAL